jgi:predicted RNA-binding protein with RPS1 domain
MDLQSFTRRAKAFDLSPLSDVDVKKLGRLFDRGTSLQDIVRQYGRELGGHPLPVFCRARLVWREYLSWRDCLQAMSSDRQESGQQLVPNDAIGRTWSPACVAAVSRAADNRAPEDYPTHSAWHEAVQLSAEFWSASLETSLQSGEVTLGSDDAPEATAPLSLDTSEWMNARTKGGDIAITLPEEALTDLIATYQDRLEAKAGLDAASVYTEVIKPGLLEAIHTVMDRRAAVEHIVGECAKALNDLSAEITAPEALTEVDHLGLKEAIDTVLALNAPPAKPAQPKAPRPRTERRARPQRTDSRRRSKNRSYNPQLSRIQDLASGMEIKGKVRNLNRFGAFVDVGIDKEGLIPQRALSTAREGGERGVRNGQMVRVRVLSVDVDRNRFDLELLETLETPKSGSDEQQNSN